MLIAMALQSWARVYDADLDQIITPTARPAVARIAENCLYGSLQLLGSYQRRWRCDLSFVSDPPWEVEPWKTIVAENNPGATPIDAPILIVQSDADGIVAPDVTTRLVDNLCARGETVELLLLAGATHLETGSDAVPEVATWIADRFEGAWTRRRAAPRRRRATRPPRRLPVSADGPGREADPRVSASPRLRTSGSRGRGTGRSSD